MQKQAAQLEKAVKEEEEKVQALVKEVNIIQS